MSHSSGLLLYLREDVKLFLPYNFLYIIFGMRKLMSWLRQETPMFAWFGGCELKEQEYDIKTKQAKL